MAASATISQGVDSPRVLAVTSTISSEGKTTTAANLPLRSRDVAGASSWAARFSETRSEGCSGFRMVPPAPCKFGEGRADATPHVGRRARGTKPPGGAARQHGPVSTDGTAKGQADPRAACRCLRRAERRAARERRRASLGRAPRRPRGHADFVVLNCPPALLTAEVAVSAIRSTLRWS